MIAHSSGFPAMTEPFGGNIYNSLEIRVLYMKRWTEIPKILEMTTSTR
jgi:hypothetical protein